MTISIRRLLLVTLVVGLFVWGVNALLGPDVPGDLSVSFFTWGISILLWLFGIALFANRRIH